MTKSLDLRQKEGVQGSHKTKPTQRHAALWLMPFALLVFTALAVPLLITEEEGLPRVRALRQELLELHEDHVRLRQEIERLEEHVKDLKSDPETIERLARDELGMIRQDEVVFQF